jgi:hypothetical protein
MDLFKPYEPRAFFPVFADRENKINYVLRETYIATPKEAIRHALGRLLKRDHTAVLPILPRIVLDSFRGLRLTFRGIFFSREGKVLAHVPPFAAVGNHQGFDVSVNALLRRLGVPLQDGQFCLICDRGVKLDGGYSIGTVGASYHTENSFTCYRNAAFARPINEFSHHRPFGFRSVAPHMKWTLDIETSVYLFNFSSNPNHNRIAHPTIRLYRNDREFIEGKFGDIPPFGAAERTMNEMFGAENREFLAPTGGMGTLIAEQPNMTLGSIHIVRNRKNKAMGIEHTRPTHLYVS